MDFGCESLFYNCIHLQLMSIPHDRMYLKFRLYGFLKNLRFFDPFIILFFRASGLSFFLIGLLYSIRYISVNILELPSGFIADALGRRRSMIFSFSSYLISFLLFYLSSDFWLYALAMVLFGAGEAFRSGTHKAMILDYLKIKGMEDMKVEYYGHTRSASQFGSAISALISLVIVFYYENYRVAFLASIVPYILELLLMLSYPAYLDGDIARGMEKSWTGLKRTFSETWRSFMRIFRSRDALTALLNSSTFDGVFEASKEYIQPILKAQALALPFLLYMADQQRIAIIVGITYFFLYLLTSLSSRSAGRFAEKVPDISAGINRTFLAGAGILLISGLSAYLGWYPLAALAFIAYYMLFNIRRPLSVGYVSDTIESRVMASGLSAESQLKTIITAVFSPLIGLIADIYGVGLALAVVAILLMILLPLVKVRRL